MEKMFNYPANEKPIEDVVSPLSEARKESENNESNKLGTKLAEYITGLKTDNPKIVERIIEDQRIIRTKYGLPSLETITNPSEYERILRRIANSLGVSIRSESECGKFFQENEFAGGVHFENDKKIGIDIDRTDTSSYLKSMSVLEHELIHALQRKYSPRMPIELMEYEAYIAGSSNELLKDDPELVDLVFSYLIGSSVMYWYDHESEKRGGAATPVWM